MLVINTILFGAIDYDSLINSAINNCLNPLSEMNSRKCTLIKMNMVSAHEKLKKKTKN